MSDITLKPVGSEDPNKAYIAWTPVPLVITRNSAPNASQKLRLESKSILGSTTRVVFMSSPSGQQLDEIIVDFANQTEITIFIAGLFQPGTMHNGASRDSKDVVIEASWLESPALVVGSLELMIRVRKNANTLSDKARTDFITALAKLNGIKVDSDPTPGPGFGVYVTDFVDMHVEGASTSQHGDSHFLPWHRLYLLDLERLLQEINPAVTLPFWRFDQPAPNVFNANFMGEVNEIPRDMSKQGGAFDQGGSNSPLARFISSNPLSNWQIRHVNGIRRAARFNPLTQPANGLTDGTPRGDFPVRNQNQTLALGGGTNNPVNAQLGSRINGDLTHFVRMEGTPHGAAHVSFNGPINFVPEAPKDPLFFLLHCNVDRLWALWQFIFQRESKTEVKSYPYQAQGDAEPWKLANATQWPWDGSLSLPGDLNAPGSRKHNFTESPTVNNFLRQIPMIENAIDAFGRLDVLDNLGFAYEDVPYTQ